MKKSAETAAAINGYMGRSFQSPTCLAARSTFYKEAFASSNIYNMSISWLVVYIALELQVETFRAGLVNS